MSIRRTYPFLVGLAGLVVAADQYSKYLVRTKIAFGGSWTPVPALEPYLKITHWSNTGAAFGLFRSGGLAFTLVAIVVSIAIVYYYGQVPRGQWAVRAALGLQLGGAIGNLIDRLAAGTVTDFISIGSFPVFNLADSAISVGVAILAITLLVEKRHAARASLAAPGQDSAPASDLPPA